MIRRRIFAALGAALLVSGLFVAVGGPVVRAATMSVSVQDDPNPAIGGVFSPQTVTISVGDTVQWNWTGSSPHSVTADDSSFDSDPPLGFRTSGSYSHTFNTPGTYAYHCRVHGAPMSGSVIVQAPPSTDTPTSMPTATNTAAPTNTPVTSTSTPGATGTPAATNTPVPSITAAAGTPAIAITQPAAAPTLPRGGSAASAQLPRTGDGGSSGGFGVRWLTIALVAAGVLLLGAALGARKRA